MAEITLEKIIVWLLLLLFIFITFFVFYSKDKGFMSKVSNLVLSIGERFLPVEPRKELKQDEAIPEKVIGVQNNFEKLIRSYVSTSANVEVCLIKFDSISSLKDFGLEISNLGDNMNTKLIKKKPESYLALSKVTINNAKACLINSQDIYNCYNSEKRICSKNMYNPNVNLLRVYDEQINVNGKDYILAPYLLKYGNNFCFIPMHKYGRGWGCDADKNSIDDDCLPQIINNIPECGKQIQQTLPEAMQKGPKEEFERFINFLKSLNSKSYPNICTKIFVFDIRKMSSGFYIFLYNNGRIDLKFNNKGFGEIIETRNIEYIPYKHVSSPDELLAYFGNYNSLRNNIIISPAGDYATTDLAEILAQDESIIAVYYENKWMLITPDVRVSGKYNFCEYTK